MVKKAWPTAMQNHILHRNWISQGFYGKISNIWVHWLYSLITHKKRHNDVDQTLDSQKYPTSHPYVKLLAVYCRYFYTLRLRQDDRYFTDDIFFNENLWISYKISLKYAPEGLIANMAALVQIMSGCQWGNKPLSEPMMASASIS